MCNLLTARNENGNLFRLLSEIGKQIPVYQNCWLENMNHKKSNGHLFHVNNPIKYKQTRMKLNLSEIIVMRNRKYPN